MDFLTVLFFVLSLISSLLTGRFAGAAGTAVTGIFFSGRSGRPFFLLSLWGHWG